ASRRVHPHVSAWRHPPPRHAAGRGDNGGRMTKLGLIAGNGRFPFLVLDAARRAGHDVTVIALKSETFPELEQLAGRDPVAAFHWISIGQLGTCIRVLKDAGVDRAIMAGQVKHTRIFADFMPDATLLDILVRLKAQNTDSLIAGVAETLRANA